MTPTDLDRSAVRRSFERSAGDYDEHAVLQREVGSRLLERLEYFSPSPKHWLDLGCGTGVATRALCEMAPAARVTGLDFSCGMLRIMSRQAGDPVPAAVCADMQQLPIASRSQDLVFSNLAIQWSTQLPELFAEIRRCLRPGGLLLFSTFGPDTLHELRSAWARVDDHPHVNSFLDMHILGDLLVNAGFRNPVMDRENITLEYRDVMSLMRDLKGIGANNAARGRRNGMTGKAQLAALLEAYEPFRRDDRYPATYEVVFGAALAPEDGQPMRTEQGEVAAFSVESLLKKGPRR